VPKIFKTEELANISNTSRYVIPLTVLSWRRMDRLWLWHCAKHIYLRAVANVSKIWVRVSSFPDPAVDTSG